MIHPSNLFLTIHESIGHATELDRALGYEAAYAGTSFATFDQLGTLPVRQSGDERDRGSAGRPWAGHHGYDDEVAQQQFEVISGGTLVGYQLNRQMAAEKGFGRSNGCAYADSPATLRCSGCPTSRFSRRLTAPAPAT